MTGAARDTVRHAILRLKSERQAVILLRYVDGFSISEVAAALDKTENNLRVIQHRAPVDLRRLMSEAPTFEPVDPNPAGRLRDGLKSHEEGVFPARMSAAAGHSFAAVTRRASRWLRLP